MLCLCSEVLQNAQINAASPNLEEEINHDLGIKDRELMEEPGQVFKEIGIRKEKDILKQEMQVRKTMQDAEKLAVDLLATRLELA